MGKSSWQKEYEAERRQRDNKRYAEELAKDPMKLLNDVEAHALANYNKGWDVWVEPMDDEIRFDILKGGKTLKGGIRKAWNNIKHYVEYRNEVIEAGK